MDARLATMEQGADNLADGAAIGDGMQLLVDQTKRWAPDSAKYQGFCWQENNASAPSMAGFYIPPALTHDELEAASAVSRWARCYPYKPISIPSALKQWIGSI
jgi:hypothetical protein